MTWDQDPRGQLERAIEWGLAIAALAVLFALALAARRADGQVLTIPPVRTVATLGACVDGSPKLVYVTDGASATDCATGSGSSEVLCRCQDGGWVGSAGTGTVSSVGLSVPAEWTVSGSPVTGSGTITIGEAAQAAGTVYAGPTSGGNAAPGFRALVAADIPGTIGSDTTGNAATATTASTATSATSATSATTALTATALAANGANCSAGNATPGVDASGAAENCFEVVTPTSTTAIAADTAGNAATASASDHDPDDCDPGEVAIGLAADWSLVCDAPAIEISGDVDLPQQVAVSGQISATLTDHVADWAPTGIATASTVLVTPSGARRVILGIAGGVTGRLLLVLNVSDTYSLGLAAENGSSTATNRIVDGFEIGPKGGALLVYDGAASRWRAAGLANYSYGGAVKMDLPVGSPSLQMGGGLNAGGAGINLTSNSDVAWTSGAADSSSREVGLRRVSSGVLGVHIGDGSTFTATLQVGETLLTPATAAPACSPGLSYYDDGDDDFCDCVGSSPAWRSRGGAGDCDGT